MNEKQRDIMELQDMIDTCIPEYREYKPIKKDLTIKLGEQERTTDVLIKRKDEIFNDCAKAIINKEASKERHHVKAMNLLVIDVTTYNLSEFEELYPLDYENQNIHEIYAWKYQNLLVDHKQYDWKDAKKYFDENYICMQCRYRVGMEYITTVNEEGTK